MATKRWIGNATSIKQVATIVVGGTWATAETATITINGKDLTVTIGANITTAQVATTIQEAYENTTLTDTTASSNPAIAATGDGGGQKIPELREMTATVNSSTVTITGDTAGKPFTISVSETSTSGTLTLTLEATAATGPNHFDNPDNWDTGTIPVDGDDIWFDSGSVDCKYELAQSGITPASINHTMGYTGEIGLPEYNIDTSNYEYREYRDKYLVLGDSADVTNVAVDIGLGDGQGSGRIKLSLNDSQCTVNVHNTGQTAESGVPAFLWKGTHASNEFNITKGTAGIAYYADDSATLATLRVGYQENQQGDSFAECGESVTLSSATITQSGGTLITRSNVSTVSISGGEYFHKSGTMGTLTVSDSTVFYESNGTCTTATFRNSGVLDCRRDMRSRTFTNLTFYANSGLRDPVGTITPSNGFDLDGCDVGDLQFFEIAKHQTLTPSAI